MTQPAETPLRILIAGPLPPEDGGTTTGGVATHVSELAHDLGSAGHVVSVYADNMPAGAPIVREWGTIYPPLPTGESLRFSSLRDGGIAVIARSVLAARSLKMRPTSTASHTMGMRRALLGASPDVIHYHHAERRPEFGRLAGADAPTVTTVHSLSAFRDVGGSDTRELSLRNLRRADRVIAVSVDTATALAEHAPDVGTTVIPNAIDVAAFSAGVESTPAAPGTPLVLFLGWIATYKGVLDLVEAMTEVRTVVPTAALAIVGPEIDLTREQVRAAWTGAPESLALAEPVSKAGVIGWLQVADVLAVPSRVRESGPRVALEAFAAGVPVVACDVGSVRLTLGDGALGTLVTPGHPEELAAAIIDALAGGDAVHERVRAAREAVDAYDSSVIRARVLEVYRTAIERHATRPTQRG